jgi:hypothetical protein
METNRWRHVYALAAFKRYRMSREQGVTSLVVGILGGVWTAYVSDVPAWGDVLIAVAMSAVI